MKRGYILFLVTLSARLGLVFALVLSGGCSDGGVVTPEPVSPPPRVALTVEGGFAGIQERLEVERDGALALFVGGVQTGGGRLDRASLERLHALVNSPSFRALSPRYMPADTCCDRFFYTLRVIRGDEEQAVATVDGATWPPPLAEAIDLLQKARQQIQATAVR